MIMIVLATIVVSIIINHKNKEVKRIGNTKEEQRGKIKAKIKEIMIAIRNIKKKNIMMMMIVEIRIMIKKVMIV